MSAKKATERLCPWYIIVLALILGVFIAAGIWRRIDDKIHPPQQQFITSIYSLAPDSTAEDLIEEGYLDLTDVQEDENLT